MKSSTLMAQEAYRQSGEVMELRIMLDLRDGRIEQLWARVKELEGLINKIYNGDCNLATASIIAANFIPPPKEAD